MIKYVTRATLNIEKYDNCISNAVNSCIYAYSWYLDIVADENWDVLVLDDYVAVMPLPWRKKYFIKYVYPPFWTLQLGIFYKTNEFAELDFVNRLQRNFKFIELRMNSGNLKDKVIKNLQFKQFQFLVLNSDYRIIKNNYRKDRKKDLKRAFDSGLIEKWNDTPEKLVQLFKDNVGIRVKKIKEKDYKVLLKLISLSIEKKVGDIVSIHDASDKLVASAFLLKHKESVTILASSTDFNNRKNGANTFLIDRIIYKYCKNFDKFNFGGSSIESIARYFKSFGAEEEEYYLLKHNNLPKLFRFLKN